MQQLAPKSPALSATHHEQLVRPQHTNAHGTAFGGEVMAWVDSVAAAAAMRHCGKAVVTASIDSLHFLAPLPMGWLALLDAHVNHAWRTSCEVEVNVKAYNPVTGESHDTVTAFLTFVAIDSLGKPSPIPPVLPHSQDEKDRSDAAQSRRAIRLNLKTAQSQKKKRDPRNI
jgi:acyl-CoA hydrolase